MAHLGCQRFNQPDYWSFNNTGLPKAVQHELMRFTGLNTSQLLRDPSQQMRYGYVGGNALSWVDLMGLCEPENIDYVNPNISVFELERLAGYVEIDQVEAIVNNAISNTTDEQFYSGRSGKNVPRYDRYIMIDSGWVDLQHVVSAANNPASFLGMGELPGALIEIGQTFEYPMSAGNPEDYRSNEIGSVAKVRDMLITDVDSVGQAVVQILNNGNPLSLSELEFTESNEFAESVGYEYGN